MGSVDIPTWSLAITAMVAGFWLVLGAWLAVRAVRRSVRGDAALQAKQRCRAMLDDAPAVPLLVYADRRLEAGERLAPLLGLGELPALFENLSSAEAGLSVDDLEALADAIRRISSTGGAASLVVRPKCSSRVLRVDCKPAPLPYPGTAVLLWFFDTTRLEQKSGALEAEVGRLTQALDALSGLVEAAPFPVWHRGPDLRLAMVNSAYVAAVDGEDAISVIKAGIELVDESDGRSPLSQAAAVRERGEPVSRALPATIAGERRMMNVVEVPVGANGVAGYAIDVEDREQARADLTRFVHAQRDMLDRLSAGVAQFGRDRSMIFFNQPFARLFSLAPEWLAEGPEFDRVIDTMRESGNLPEVRDFPDWKETRRGWFTSGLAPSEEDWLLPGGKHLRVVAQPLPDGGLVLIFEDRTEQIQLASARDTLLRVRTATFDNLFEAIGVFASDGRLHLWNNRFREVWDFDEELLATHPRVDALTVHLAKKLKNPNHAGLVRELVRSATVERKTRTGRVSMIDGRDFEFAAVPLPDGNALFTMLDVTDSRMIEAALRDRNAALEEADRMKTAFVSNMSYELRTPLTSIAGFAEMLAGGYAGELKPMAADYVQAILESVARLGVLIDNVLDLTQSDTGGLLLAEEEVDLTALCRDAASAVATIAQARSIDFAVELDPALGTITGDRRRLGQALDNILRNAVMYTPERGRVLLHGAGDHAAVQITVSDNGAGIAPGEQSRVFDRFHRTIAASGGGRHEALGLGLPLAKQFVEAHGGAIELQSELGAGTSVAIRLPRTR